ncbi:MAG: DsbA family protein [Comamonadaceae bacterium]|nr:MAG: DsbA family protein [Comamonadaceae bacterium]
MTTSPRAATLHYIHDPLCGWCYAAAPLVEAARQVPGLSVQWHAGGMMAGAARRAITAQWRDYVMPHDQRIAALTGQPFGAAYFDGLLRDTTAVMDSEPPITAMLAAEALHPGSGGLDMLHRAQTAHYAQGRRIADTEVLHALAAEAGWDSAAFASAFAQARGAATQRHIDASRQRLRAVGGQGFPTLVLEAADGSQQVQDLSPWLGRAAAWQDHLAGLVAAQPGPDAQAKGPAMVCIPGEGCGPA